MTYDHNEEFHEEMRRDAFQSTYADFEAFAAHHPLCDYEHQAGLEMIHDDDQSCRLIEEHGEAVMRLLMRHYCNGIGLDKDYDTDQRVRDEGAISRYLTGQVDEIQRRLQREDYES